MDKTPDISVVLPCLNEEEGIGLCISEIHAAMRDQPWSYEIVVCDNGSSDQSALAAESAGARVVYEPKRGYGSALGTGMRAAQGNFFVLADADGTYDLSKIPEFVSCLEAGADIVIGNRFGAPMIRGAMPFLHQYLGNPLLSWLVRCWFGVKVRDTHCGMRALKREACQKLNLRTSGMEFASEMVMRAGSLGLNIQEVPISYRPRLGESKLRTFRDGWRHLRFMLLFAPTVLFFVPGFVLIAAGLALLIPMTFGPFVLGPLKFHLHPMFGAALAVVLGVQLVSLGVCTKLFSVREQYVLPDRLVRWWQKYVTLERLLIAGGAVLVAGIVIAANVFWHWAKIGFGALEAVRPLIAAMTLIVVGCQILFTAFFVSLITLHNKL